MVVNYDDFAETFGASRQSLHWEEIQIILDDFVDHFSAVETWKIADIGCGNGRLLRHILQESRYLSQFQAHHTHYFGADLSQKLLTQAAESLELGEVADMIEWKCMDMRNMGETLFNPLFEAVFFVASFHHLEIYSDRLDVLRAAKKILVPGGKIYMINWFLLSQKNQKYFSSKIIDYSDGSADFGIKIGKHNRFYHSFSTEEYQKLAQECGLQLEKTEFGERNSIVIFS